MNRIQELTEKLQILKKEKHPFILNELSCLICEKDPKQSLEYAKAANGMIKGDNEEKRKSFYNMGAAYYHLQRYKDSIEVFEIILERMLKEKAEDQRTTKDHLDIMDIYSKLGLSSLHLGNNPEAVNLLERAHDLSTRFGDETDKADSANNLGTIYLRTGKLKEALELHKAAMAKYESGPEIQRKIICAYNLGGDYMLLGQMDTALDYFFMSLDYCNPAVHGSHIAMSFNQIAYVYKELGALGKAEEYYQKALKTSQENNDLANAASISCNLANLLSNSSKFDDAIKHYTYSLDIARKFDDYCSQSKYLHNIGHLHAMQGNIGTALVHYKKALSYMEKTGIKQEYAHCLGSLATAHMDLNELAKAKTYLDKALEYSRETGSKESLYKCWFRYSTYYEKLGDFEKALKYYKDYTDARDEVYNQKSADKLSNLSARYESVNKAKEADAARNLAEEYKKRNQELDNANKLIEKQNQELREAYAKMENLARTDFLTQLPNRRDMLDRLEKEISRFERKGLNFSIILFDIDNFKFINDAYGHDAGDNILRQISALLGMVLRKHDSAGRWGGEEFIIILPGTDIHQARNVAEKIRKLTEDEIFMYKEHAIQVFITLGVTEYQQGSNIADSLKKADLALYTGKKNGKNCVVVNM